MANATIQASPSVEADKKFLAGQIYTENKTTYQYLYVPANTEKGEILVRDYDGDEESNPKAVASATSAFPKKIVVATQDQGTSAGFQWCVVSGECQALVDGTTDVAKDDYLEVLNGADGLIKDGTARTTVSCAIAREAQATDADTLTDIYLFPETNTIAAS